MNYKEKYDMALERAKKVNKGEVDGEPGTRICEYIFPELKESEDEKVRKSLITFFQRFPYDSMENAGTNPKEAIAWLEKQESVEEIVARCKDSWYNEGKIAGMAEGLTDDEKYQQGWHDALEKQGEHKQEINNFDILPGLYKCVHRMFDGTSESRLLFEVGEVYRCLSKHDRAEFEVSYGHSVYLEDPVVRKHFIPFEKQGEKPKKMKEAGYEWNAEKKELNEIKQENDTSIAIHNEKAYKIGFSDGEAHAKEQLVWSEEDERNMQNIDSVVFYDNSLPEDTCVRLRNWLKSVKQKIGG